VARKRNRRKPIPDGLFDASIDSLTSDARGVARIDGKATFINGALPGEEVRFRYTRCKSKYDEGVVEKIISASPDRVEPKCEYHLICGGCSLQHLSAEAQVQMKQQQLLDNFEQIGKVTPEKVLPPMMGDRWGYRRKARLGVRDVRAKGRVLVGFREKSNRYLADIHSCEVLHRSVGYRLDELSNLIGSMHGRQVIAQIEVAVSDEVTALVFRNLEPLDDYDLSILTNYAKQSGLNIYLQHGDAETIKPLWPEASSLSYTIPEYDIQIEFLPADFTQVNASINQQMVSAAIDLLHVKSDESVLDLFCGLGNFTTAIARKAHQVTGIEGDAGLVDRARQNALNNHLDNIQFSVANLFEDIALQAWSNHDYDKLLLDPPRSGAQAIVENISRINPGRIVYVSCHPATLARDAGILVDSGYRLLQTGIMDMFPHTMHVESIAVFERT